MQDREAAERRDPAERERELFERLPGFLRLARSRAPALARRLEGIDCETLSSRAALSSLPVLRKPELLEMQMADPPFGGHVDLQAIAGSRVFLSPGPIWEPQAPGQDPAQAARAFHAAGVRPDDIVHNAFSYHMTPGGLILDHGALALGCTVFPAGTGNTDMQVEAAAALRPTVYCGTPDFLKVILDRAAELGKDLSSFARALVSGGALFPSLRADYLARGVNTFQCYATAEFGVIAFETAGPDGLPLPGMVVNEDLIVEIVRPGTDDPVPDGEVGELVVTGFNPVYPLVRLGTGDLSRILTGPSPCGRTNRRLAGWLGRADQRTKIKGMFVDPKQVAEVLRRHGGIDRAQLVVTRDGERDQMLMRVVPRQGASIETDSVAALLREVTKLSGSVELVGSLPDDGRVIADERDYKA